MLIVTDGAVDIPERLEESPIVRRVTGGVWLDGHPMQGGPDEFWSLVRQGYFPSTTPPTVSDLVQAYRHPDLVIGLHVSTELSATMAHAREAASRSLNGVVVLDTRSFSVGAGLLVAVVHRATLQPEGIESLSDFAASLPDRLHTFAVIQDIESLRRSDRSGLLPQGHLAKNHPLMIAVRGRVVTIGQPRQTSNALKDIARHARLGASHIGAWAIGHGDAKDPTSLMDALAESIGSPPAFVTRLDPAVGAHLGAGSLVVGVVSDPVKI
jgi:DegV family protein with EDD domain